jgi:hypothetical protein
VIAAAILAVHYVADVPIRWASGGQDLLAVAGAIAALWLFVCGRAQLAGLAVLLAMLSKETVVMTPFIAVALGRRAGEPWRATLVRAWPLFAAVAAWASLWMGATSRVGGADVLLERDPAGVIAALAHFAQTLVGIEWPGARIPPLTAVAVWGPVLIVAAAAGVAFSRRVPHGAAGDDRARALQGGLAWALLGALPVAAAVSNWSAYYYLFAVCGAALAIGALLARGPAPVALAVVLALGVTSQIGRGLAEFSTVPQRWNTQSRVNSFYIDRSMRFLRLYLDDLRAQRPTLPERSTLFFSGLPAYVGWQAADGPLVRWAYRDSSLRSYFLASLTMERVRRGPAFFFTATRDSLIEVLPEHVSFRNVGMIMLLDGKDEAAREAWRLHVEAHPDDREARYWLGMSVALAGDAAGVRLLEAVGVSLEPGPAPEVQAALRVIATGDTLRAWQLCLDGVARHGGDPGVHALLADISLSRATTEAMGIFEAWLVHRMAPDDLPSMRRWAGVLVRQNRFERGVRLLERYLAAGGEDPETDAAIRGWLADTRRRLPGGDLAGEGLRGEARVP